MTFPAFLTDRSTSLLRIAFSGGLLLLGLAACSNDSEPAAATDTPAPPVRVAEVTETSAGHSVRLPGVVRAARRARPAFLHPGTLAVRLVERGERVEAGQRLAVLHNPALAPAVAAAEARVGELDARLARLRRDVQRLQPLRTKGVASEEELDAVESELAATGQAREQAVAELESAREQLAEANLRAPFAGRVGDLLVEPGDFVTAGQPILTLVGHDALEIEVALSASLEDVLVTDREVIITRPLQGGEFTGTVSAVGAVGDPAGMAPAVIALNRADALAPGQAVHVHLETTGETRLEVPLTALLDPGGRQPRVLRVGPDDRVENVSVSVGRMAGDRVVVEGGLAAGDRVVIAGHGHLAAGQKVRVLP